MTQLCKYCVCINVNGTRCHEHGCPNQNEQIYLVDDGTLDTVFQCNNCGDQIRFNYATDDTGDDYDSFLYECLHEAQEEHVCTD